MRYFHDLEKPAGRPLSTPPHERSRLHPPLLYLATIPFYLAAGMERTAAGLTQALFLALMLWAVFGIGGRLYTARAGLLAAALLSMFPLIIGFSRLYLLAIPEAAMSCLTLYVMLRTEGFRSGAWCLALGAAIGLGMLTAPRFIFLIAPPLVYFAFSSPRRIFPAPGISGRGRAILLVILPAVLIAGPWYVQLIQRRGTFDASPLLRQLFTVSPARLLSLPGLIFRGVSVPLAAVIVTGLASAAWHGNVSRLLLIWLIVPPALLDLFPVPEHQPVIAALPPAALLTAAGIMAIRRRWIRRFVIGAACAWGIVVFAKLSLPLPWSRTRDLIPIPREMRAAGYLFSIRPISPPSGPRSADIWTPQREAWRIDDIFSDIAAISGADPGEKALVAWFIARHPRFNRSSLLYELEKGGYPIETVRPERAQYVLTRLTSAGQRERFEEWGRSGRRLEKIKTYPLPDGSEAALYYALPLHRLKYAAAELAPADGSNKAADPDAAGGWACFAENGKTAPGDLLALALPELEPGAYRLAIRLKYDRQTGEGPVASIHLAGDGRPILQREISTPDIGKPRRYGVVKYDFSLPKQIPLRFGLSYAGGCDVWIDSLELYPVAASP